MQKFEYKTFKINQRKGFVLNTELPEIENRLNELGAEGWELINAVHSLQSGSGYEVIFFFKRKISMAS